MVGEQLGFFVDIKVDRVVGIQVFGRVQEVFLFVALFCLFFVYILDEDFLKERM